MNDYNAASVLGDDVRYVRSTRIFEERKDRLKFTSIEKSNETIKAKIDSLLLNITNHLGFSVQENTINDAKKKFPMFDKCNIEMFVLAVYVINRMEVKLNIVLLKEIIIDNSSSYTVFPTLKELLLKPDGEENFLVDLNRYIERLNSQVII